MNETQFHRGPDEGSLHLEPSLGLASLPSSLKLRRSEGKCLLKKTMEPDLLSKILYRQKMGFEVPLVRRFRGALREPLTRTMLGVRDYSTAVWTLFMFDAFLANAMREPVWAAVERAIG